MSRPLPRAKTRALGKDMVCRVPGNEHSANICHTACPSVAECWPSAKSGTRQHVPFAECWPGGTRQRLRTCPARAPAVRRPLRWLTTVRFCRVLQGRHSAKTKFRRVPVGGTRQSQFRRVPSTWHSANNFYFYFFHSTFLLSTQI